MSSQHKFKIIGIFVLAVALTVTLGACDMLFDVFDDTDDEIYVEEVDLPDDIEVLPGTEENKVIESYLPEETEVILSDGNEETLDITWKVPSSYDGNPKTTITQGYEFKAKIYFNDTLYENIVEVFVASEEIYELEDKGGFSEEELEKVVMKEGEIELDQKQYDKMEESFNKLLESDLDSSIKSKIENVLDERKLDIKELKEVSQKIQDEITNSNFESNEMLLVDKIKYEEEIPQSDIATLEEGSELVFSPISERGDRDFFDAETGEIILGKDGAGISVYKGANKQTGFLGFSLNNWIGGARADAWQEMIYHVPEETEVEVEAEFDYVESTWTPGAAAATSNLFSEFEDKRREEIIINPLLSWDYVLDKAIFIGQFVLPGTEISTVGGAVATLGSATYDAVDLMYSFAELSHPKDEEIYYETTLEPGTYRLRVGISGRATGAAAGVAKNTYLGFLEEVRISSHKDYPPDEYTLDVSTEGEGSVEIDPEKAEYEEGTEVELEAIPDEGWNFDYWEGDVEDADSAETTITMDENKAVTAHFKEKDDQSRETGEYVLFYDFEDGELNPFEKGINYEDGCSYDFTPCEWGVTTKDVISGNYSAYTYVNNNNIDIYADLSKEDDLDELPSGVYFKTKVSERHSVSDWNRVDYRFYADTDGENMIGRIIFDYDVGHSNTSYPILWYDGDENNQLGNLSWEGDTIYEIGFEVLDVEQGKGEVTINGNSFDVDLDYSSDEIQILNFRNYGTGSSGDEIKVWYDDIYLKHDDFEENGDFTDPTEGEVIITKEDLTGDGYEDIRLENNEIFLELHGEDLSGENYADLAGLSDEGNMIGSKGLGSSLQEPSKYKEFQEVETLTIIEEDSDKAKYEIATNYTLGGNPVIISWIVTLEKGNAFATADLKVTNKGESSFELEYPSGDIHDGIQILDLPRLDTNVDSDDYRFYLPNQGTFTFTDEFNWSTYSNTKWGTIFDNEQAFTFGYIKGSTIPNKWMTNNSSETLDYLVNSATLSPGETIEYSTLIGFHEGGSNAPEIGENIYNEVD